MKLNVFPNSQLGGDNDLLSQVRSGAIEICQPAGQILASILPLTAINGMGFAFSSYDKVWPAIDGELGKFVRAPDHRQGRPGADGTCRRLRLVRVGPSARIRVPQLPEAGLDGRRLTRGSGTRGSASEAEA